jgi:hypothetical protein
MKHLILPLFLLTLYFDSNGLMPNVSQPVPRVEPCEASVIAIKKSDKEVTSKASKPSNYEFDFLLTGWPSHIQSPDWNDQEVKVLEL